jgi:hypothetical protein
MNRNYFEEVLSEYEDTKDISSFKQLTFRPTDISQYLSSLPSIFVYIQHNIINDSRDFTESKADILKDCLFRLVDSYNVSLSHSYDEYNPIIFYFPQLYSIGIYLLNWLLLSYHDTTLVDYLFLHDQEELITIRDKAYSLTVFLFSSYKYLSHFQAFNLQRTNCLFQSFLLWLSLAPYDKKEQYTGYPSDRLVDISMEYEEIVKENTEKIFQTFDYLMITLLPIPYGKVYNCFCDLFMILYDDSYEPAPVNEKEKQKVIVTATEHEKSETETEQEEVDSFPSKEMEEQARMIKQVNRERTIYYQQLINQRLEKILLITEVNFEGSKGLLNKIMVINRKIISNSVNDTGIALFQSSGPLGRKFLELYYFDENVKEWKIDNRENSRIQVKRTLSPKNLLLPLPIPPVPSPLPTHNSNNNPPPAGRKSPLPNIDSLSMNTNILPASVGSSSNTPAVSSSLTSSSSSSALVKDGDKTITIGEKRSPKSSKSSSPSSSSSQLITGIPRSPPRPPPALMSANMKFGSYLRKVGSFIPSIHRRWFQLTEDKYIRYYVDESKSNMKGEFQTSDIKCVSSLSLDNWFEWKMDSSIHNGLFKLRCDSPEVYYSWINYLRRCGVVINPSKDLNNGKVKGNGKAKEK